VRRFAADDQVFRLHIPLSLTSRPLIATCNGPSRQAAGRVADITAAVV